jgi:hypothetical protein
MTLKIIAIKIIILVTWSIMYSNSNNNYKSSNIILTIEIYSFIMLTSIRWRISDFLERGRPLLKYGTQNQQF